MGNVNIYNIGGQDYTQTELTYGQDKQLMELVENLPLSQDTQISLENVRNILTKHDAIADFLHIILNPVPAYMFFGWLKIKPPEKIPVDNITNSLMETIFKDFFLLNRVFLERLAGLTNYMGLIARTIIYTAEAHQKAPVASNGSEKKTE